MARRLRRRYRRRRRYRPRRYRRRGKARAAATQRQTSRVVVKSMNPGVIQIFPAGYTGEGQEIAPNFAGTACISAYQNLLCSNYFQTLAKMYDQFKLDSFKVKITPTQSVLLQGQKQAVFVSAWDRNGITNSNSIPSFNEIASYGSAFQRTINLDATSWTATRKIYASTIMEKSSYVPTAVPGSNNVTNMPHDQLYQMPWNPQLLIGVLCTVGSPTSSVQTNPLGQVQFSGTQSWAFMCEFQWHLTFRGLRYDAPSSAPMVNARMTTNATAALGLGRNDVQPTMSQTQLPSQIAPSTPQQPPSLQPTVPPGTAFILRDFYVSSQNTRIVPQFVQATSLLPSINYIYNTYQDKFTFGMKATNPEYSASVWLVVLCVPDPLRVSVSIVLTHSEKDEQMLVSMAVSQPGVPAYARYLYLGYLDFSGYIFARPDPAGAYNLCFTAFANNTQSLGVFGFSGFSGVGVPEKYWVLDKQTGVTNVVYAYSDGDVTKTVNVWPNVKGLEVEDPGITLPDS